MTKLTFRCAPHVGLIPVDDDGVAYIAKRAGKLVEVKVTQPRSLDQNAMLWAVATTTFDTLPEKWQGVWADKYRMVKGLQLVLGLVDQTMKPTKTGPEAVSVPSSIAEMDAPEANAACDLLFRGMARLLDVPVEALINETNARTALWPRGE